MDAVIGCVHCGLSAACCGVSHFSNFFFLFGEWYARFSQTWLYYINGYFYSGHFFRIPPLVAFHGCPIILTVCVIQQLRITRKSRSGIRLNVSAIESVPYHIVYSIILLWLPQFVIHLISHWLCWILVRISQSKPPISMTWYNFFYKYEINRIW